MSTEVNPLDQRTSDLRAWMGELLQLLGHKPSLVFLHGYMAEQIRYGITAGGISLELVLAVEAIAKAEGATAEQMELILPQDQLKSVLPEEECALVRPGEPDKSEEPGIC